MKKFIVGFLFVLLTTSIAVSRESTKYEQINPLLFKKVEIPYETFSPTLEPTLPPTLAPTLEPTPKATPILIYTDTTVSGVPTYYCWAGSSRCTRGYPDGPEIDFYAAAGPPLRVGDWRGRVVEVCANNTCIHVKLIDWCACASPHFLDLYHDAFVALGKPSWATVSW